MNIDAAVSLCKTFEGLYLKPYTCPAGVPTIGYGSTFYEDGRRVALTDSPISAQRAEQLLMHELERVCVPGVLRFCPNLARFEGPFNAAVDFVYNLGVGRLQTSTLRRKLLAEDWAGAQEELGKWVRGGGRVLPGLVKRRACEAALL